MRLTPAEVANIEKLVEDGRLTEIMIEQDGERVVIGGAIPAAELNEPIAIVAPVAGTVSFGGTAVGQPVAQDDIVATVGVLDTETSVTAPVSGRIEAILVKDGALVGYGAELILLEPKTPS